MNRQILLAQRPQGDLDSSDFTLVQGADPVLSDGQILIRNAFLSMDPAIRGWMSAGASYVRPIEVGAVIRSAVIGEVLESRHLDFEPGDHWVGLGGWEQLSAVDPRMGRKIPPMPLPLSTSLGVLGGNGLTAWFGMHDVGRPQAGDTVVVSAAAGGVGSIAGQLAKRLGCTVIGIVGSDEKARWITEDLGFDAAINRRTEPVYAALKAFPKVDVYFDNVGGPILDDVLARIAVGARVVICGAISQINAAELPPGPKNYIRLLTQRASMRGFVTLDFAPRWQEASTALAELVISGDLVHREHIIDGLENAPDALAGMFRGDNLGKLMIRLAPG